MHSTPDRTTFDFIRMLGDIIRFQNQGAMILLCQIGSQRRKQDQGISPVDLYLPINIDSVSISDCRCDVEMLHPVRVMTTPENKR